MYDISTGQYQSSSGLLADDDDDLVSDSLHFIPESNRKTILALLSVAIAVVCLGVLIIVVTVIWIATK